MLIVILASYKIQFIRVDDSMVSDPSNNKFILKREVLSYFEKYINSRGLEFL